MTTETKDWNTADRSVCCKGFEDTGCTVKLGGYYL